MGWVKVLDRLPDCWSQHRDDYASGYLLGYTKYGDVEVVQLWHIKGEDGKYFYHWETEHEEDSGYVRYWMNLPKPPEDL